MVKRLIVLLLITACESISQNTKINLKIGFLQKKIFEELLRNYKTDKIEKLYDMGGEGSIEDGERSEIFNNKDMSIAIFLYAYINVHIKYSQILPQVK